MSNETNSTTAELPAATEPSNNVIEDRPVQNKITGRQIRTVLVSSTGFFMDAYDIFVINLVVPMLGYVYYINHNNAMPSNIQGIVKGITNVGNLFGQIIFGCLGDSKGRKSVYGIELLIIIVATVGSAMAGSAATGVGTLGFLGFWRFLLGVGIGGDYPMSATVSSEWSSAGRRGQMLALTFSMQGWGQFLAALFDIIVLAIFKGAIEANQINLDYVWRILLALGIVPAVCTLYSRFHLPESPRYAERVLKDVELAAIGKAYALGENPQVSSDVAYEKPADNRRHLRDFWTYFAQWSNFKVLLGTCSTWFLLDIAFYGLSLNQSIVLSAIGFAPDATTTSPWQTLWKQAIGNLIITLLGSLPGYYVTGVDRSALDIAIELGFEYGGWCPRGRKAEDGVIDPIKYANLQETSTDIYSQRTEYNVRDSDGTLIIIAGEENTMDSGTKLTVNMAEKYHKPLLIVQLNDENPSLNETKVTQWLSTNEIRVLNIAGPREESVAGIYLQARSFLRNLCQKINS